MAGDQTRNPEQKKTNRMSISALDKSLRDVERSLFDSSALIAFHERAEAVHPLATHLMRRVETDTDPLNGFYSVVSAAEMLVRPLRAGATEYAYMHAFLTGFPHLLPLTMDLAVAQQAATIRANTGLRLPDAIVVASGLLAGCEAIITNDERWHQRLSLLFRQFRWIYLGNYQ